MTTDGIDLAGAVADAKNRVNDFPRIQAELSSNPKYQPLWKFLQSRGYIATKFNKESIYQWLEPESAETIEKLFRLLRRREQTRYFKEQQALPLKKSYTMLTLIFPPKDKGKNWRIGSLIEIARNASEVEDVQDNGSEYQDETIEAFKTAMFEVLDCYFPRLSKAERA